jgi:hypothetical protein
MIFLIKKPPHPLPPARVKNSNKSLTHNTKNNKKGEKTHATLPLLGVKKCDKRIYYKKKTHAPFPLQE